MDKNDRLVKGLSEFSIIFFCLSIIVFAISFPTIELTNNTNYMALSVISTILMSISSILVLVISIILIVKVCGNSALSTTDKILWGFYLYFGNLFVIPFAINKYILKNNDYSYAKKYFIFEIITLSISVLIFIFIFFQMISLMDF